MAYELVNAKLDIWTCSINDLNAQLLEFIKDQGREKLSEGVSLELLRVFFEPTGGRIILNRDHPNFSVCVKLCEVYLLLDGEGEREDFISETPLLLEHFQGVIAVLETAIRERKMLHQWTS